MFLKTNILPDLAAPRNLILLLICQLVCEPSRKFAELAIQRQADQLAILRQIDQATLAAKSPLETTPGILSWLLQLIPISGVSAWEFDFASDKARRLGGLRDQSQSENPTAVVALGQPAYMSALRAGDLVVVSNADDGAADSILGQLLDSGADLITIVPMSADNELLGGLYLELPPNGTLSSIQLEAVTQTTNSLALSIRQFRLFAAVQERAERLTALQESITALNKAISLQEKFRTIQQQVLHIHPDFFQPFFVIVPPGGDALTPYLLEEENAALSALEARLEVDLKKYRLPLDQIPEGQLDLLQAGFPVIISEMTESLAKPLPKTVVEWLTGLPNLKSILAIPFNLEERLLGVMFVGGPRALARDEVQLLTALANQAAIAFQNARLFELVRAGRHRLQNLSKQLLDVQEQERRHIARELHDQIGQALTALKINLQALDRFLPQGEADVYMNESMEIAEKTLQQVRNLSLDLRPSLLDDLGLVPAVRWYLDRQGQRTGIKIKFVAEIGDERLPMQIETTCFRVIQEALTNVVRHAQASRVRVELGQEGNVVDLLMRDDGVGFDVKAAMEDASKGQSLGILGLQERIYMIGGRVQFESVLNHGTEIRAQLPIDGNARIERRTSRR